MATVTKRGSWQWQAKVRKKGISTTKTFETKAEAEDWTAALPNRPYCCDPVASLR